MIRIWRVLVDIGSRRKGIVPKTIWRHHKLWETINIAGSFLEGVQGRRDGVWWWSGLHLQQHCLQKKRELVFISAPPNIVTYIQCSYAACNCTKSYLQPKSLLSQSSTSEKKTTLKCFQHYKKMTELRVSIDYLYIHKLYTDISLDK